MSLCAECGYYFLCNFVGWNLVVHQGGQVDLTAMIYDVKRRFAEHS